MAAEIGVFTPEQARMIWQDYQTRRQRPTPTVYPVNHPSHRRRPAVIGTDLLAPASSLVTATTCTAYFLDLQEDGTQVLNPEPVTIYNDDPEVTAEVGTYCRLHTVNGRWMIYYLGCDPQQALVDAIPE
jgi:hypothetical protein